MPNPAFSDGIREILDRIASPVSVPKNSDVFKQGDTPIGVYVVRRGLIRMTVEAEQGDVLLRVAQPGAVIGLSGVLGNKPYSLTATTIQAAELGFVATPNLLDTMRSNTALGFQILRLLSDDVRAARTAIATGCRVQ